MSYESFIGLRYLMAKQRSRVVSIITLISIAGVALGVTAMIVVLSVMGGFKKDLKEKILGTKAHVVVEDRHGEPIDGAGQVVDAAESLDDVRGAAAFIDSEVMISSPSNLNGMKLRGIEPSSVSEVSDLDEEVYEGKLAYLDDPGPLMETLGSRTGDREGSILDEIERERSEPEPASGAPPDPGRSEGGDRYESTGEPSVGSEATDEALDRGGGESMPTIVEGDGGEDAGRTRAEGREDGAGEQESSGSDSSGGMPPILDSDSGESEDSTGSDEPSSGDRIPGILLGKELAKTLKVELGDEVTVVTPKGEIGPTGPLPNSRPFRVVGLFYTGMYKYDANYGYTSLSSARELLNLSGVSGVELETRRVDDAMGVADRLAERVPDDLQVRDWKEMNRSLFYALRLEKIAMFVVLAFIILVASFSIIAMLIMIVIEKKRDISVLKSMGVSDGGIMRIFMIQGVVIGAVGAAIGLVLGLSICWALIEFGFPLNSEVYYISTLPVQIDPVEVGLVVFCTIAISFLATIYPSRKAAELPPVEGLRYE